MAIPYKITGEKIYYWPNGDGYKPRRYKDYVFYDIRDAGSSRCTLIHSVHRDEAVIVRQVNEDSSGLDRDARLTYVPTLEQVDDWFGKYDIRKAGQYKFDWKPGDKIKRDRIGLPVARKVIVKLPF